MRIFIHLFLFRAQAKMDGRSELSRKRRQVNDGGPSNRRQKYESNEDLAEPLKIIDLNNDCLESIFKRLSINDLLNVAVSNSCFHVAAASVFKHKFGQKTIEILFQRSQYITRIGCFLEIRNLKTCLHFLRTFGHLIIKLKVVYMFHSRQQFALVDRYIDKYCAESVKEIHFLGYKTPEILVHVPRKPFHRVELMSVMDCNLGRQLPQFVSWFPNLQQLEIHWSTVDWSCVEINFPQLQHLRLFDIEFGSNFGLDNVAKLLRSNPQLKVFDVVSFQSQLTFHQFSRMISKNVAITKLILLRNLFKPSIKVAELSKLTQILPALIELDLRSYSWDLTIKRIATLIRQRDLGQLKKITFWSSIVDDGNSSHAQLDNEWQATIRGREITLTR